MLSLGKLLNTLRYIFFLLSCTFLFPQSYGQDVAWGNRLKGGKNSADIVLATEQGTVYACGYFFDPQKINPEGYIIRYDSRGNALWQQRLVFGASGAIINGRTNSIGDLYIIGSFNESVLFNSEWIENTSSFDESIFIAKYSSSGEPEWIRPLPEGILYQRSSFASDSQMNLYVLCQQYTYLDPNTITVSDKGSFIIKYDRDGNYLGEINLIGDFNIWSHVLAIDANDQLIMMAEFYGSLTIGETTINSDDGSLTDAFIAKFDNEGNPIWSRNIGSPNGRDYVRDLETDGIGNIYLTGGMSNEAILVKFDGAGNKLWELPAKYQDIWPTRCKVNARGDVYLAGSFKGSVSLGGYALNNVDGSSLFFVKVSPAGEVLWALQGSNSQADEWSLFYDISINPLGELFLAGGTYTSSVTFGQIELSEDDHDENSLIFKVSEPAYQPPMLNLGEDTFVCEFDKIKLTANGFALYTWNDASHDSVLVATETGEYYVEAKDYLGNIQRDTVFIDSCRQLFIPNVITVNGDEWNEYFVIQNLDITKDYTLQILNRLGQPVYSTNSYKNNWSGNGLVSGIYFYQLTDIYKNKLYKGWLQVLK